MRKHISILLSVSAFLCSSFALSAQSTTSQDTMYQDKTAEYNYETQSGTITLENYVPGEMKVSHDAQPLDALLILDFSGSMNTSYGSTEDFTQTYVTKRYRGKDFGYGSDDSSGEKKSSISVNYNGTSYPVYMKHIFENNKTYDWLYILVNSDKVYLRPDGSFVIPANNNTPTSTSWPTTKDDGLPIEPILAQEMIYCETSTRAAKTTTRALALQKAVGNFLDLVANHATNTKKKDRVSIVSFQTSNEDFRYTKQYNSDRWSTAYVTKGNNAYLTEKYHDYKYNGSDWTTKQNDNYGKSGVIKRWMDISSQNALTILKRGISDLTFQQQTPHDAGANIARELMKISRSTEGKESVAQFVIYFSDGVPTSDSGTGFSSDVANKALATTDSIKKAYPNAKFYSIYCNTESISGYPLAFMQKLSSDYKDASSLTTGTRTDPSTDTSKYYKWAKEDLSKVFDEISQEILEVTTSKYNVNTTLNDFVNNAYFKLPDEVDQTTAYDNIFVYENKCAGYDKTTNTYSWATFEGDSTKLLTKADGITINITKRDQTIATSNDKVEIKGYDFSKNWCGMDISVNPNIAHGARLVIKIPFVYTKTQVFGDLPTNTKDSGITVVDSLGKVIEKKEYPVPTLPFCYIKIQRDSLHKGESAIYLIEKPKDDGTYEFVDKVVVNGSGSKIDTCTLYGVPGTKFRVTETNWNWAYDKTNNPQTQSLPTDSEGKPTSYKLFYEFKGDHKVATGSSHEQEKDPANLHNHDEAFKVNSLALPPKK